MGLSTEDILNEIKLPDYRGRHVFTARLRLLIFSVFWIIYLVCFNAPWKGPYFIPVAISLSFLTTGICYHNILRGRAIVSSFLLEITADLFAITLIVYMSGGENSQFFTLYIIYATAAGIFYSNTIAWVAAILSAFFYTLLVLFLYFKFLIPFQFATGRLLTTNSHLDFFLNLFLLVISLPIVVYGAKIANHFSRIKERALEERNKQLIALNRISSTIKGVLSMEKAVRQVLAGVMEGLGYDICILAIPSKKDSSIIFHAPKNHELTQKIEEILKTPISNLRLSDMQANSVFQMIQKNKIIFRENFFELVEGIEPSIPLEEALLIQKKLNLKKFVITPLVVERQIVGALIGVTRKEYIDQSSFDVLENFANQAALTIESAQLFEELRQKNIDLEQANKIKGEFMAIMSHELRTPLIAIIGFSELLLEGVIGELKAEQKEYLMEVLRNSDHLLHLINSILDLSKVESGKMDLNFELFSLEDLVSDVSKTVQPLLHKKGLSLVLKTGKDFPLLEADPRKIKQIFLNLLSNAIKFTPEEGKLKIQIEYYSSLDDLKKCNSALSNVSISNPFEKGLFKIVVEDNGIGIREKDLDEIFESFSQVDSSYTRKYQGTGLGLTLSKKFVEMHGGVIWVESEYEQGSKFVILLPRVSAI